MEEFKGTRLTLEIGGTKAIWETDRWDHSVDEILEALRGLLVTHTYQDTSFVRCCGNFYEENKKEEL